MRTYGRQLAGGIVALTLGMTLLTARGGNEPVSFGFDDKNDLEQWSVTGDVAVDATQKTNGASALRVGPNSRAEFKFRAENGSGKFDLMVYDGMQMPEDLKLRRIGPRWGLLQADGRVLGVGHMFAPYLAGNRAHASTEYFDGGSWFNVQSLGDAQRKAGWNKWTFDMNSTNGLSILMNDKPINKFNWIGTEFEGFVGVVLLGDTGPEPHDIIWVDALTVTPGGPMKQKPEASPETDPPVEGKKVTLIKSVAGVHPRLLFGPKDIPAMKAFAESETGQPIMAAVVRYLPDCIPPEKSVFIANDLQGQRHGLWRPPTVALHYVLTGDTNSFAKTVGYMKQLLALPEWQRGPEISSGMGAANLMIGAALAYDWLYNDLDPEFREQFRQKLLRQARAMYYGGHLKRNRNRNTYWQNDPQNNHRWHRDAGLALCALAAAEGNPEEDWILKKTREELQYIVDWLPEDGTSHESPTYMIFGIAQLVLAVQASDCCFGTEFLKAPFFKNIGDYMTQTYTPGLESRFPYGDCGTSVGQLSNDLALYKCASVHREGHVQAILNLLRERSGVMWGWMCMLWYDPTLKPTSMEDLPQTAMFDDLGLAILRDSWNKGGVAAMFKCGPLGGYTLNRYRNENNFKYINVAHDDPDANSFVIFGQNEFLAESDRYSMRKMSANHNTILINGMGQMPVGRGEPIGYSQPGRGDMTKMAVLTAWKDAGDVVIAEGEASGSYLSHTDRKTKQKRPALDRFRRTFVWVKGSYILALDDIRAPEPVTVTWLMQGLDLKPVDAAQGRYRLIAKDATCDFQLVSDQPFKTEIVTRTPADFADRYDKEITRQQLRASTEAATTRFVSVFDPWQRKNLTTALDGDTVTVSGPGFTDTWTYQPATDKFSASRLHGTRPDGFDVVVDASCTPSQP